MTVIINFEISDYLNDQIATIPLNFSSISAMELTINLVNANIASSILLDILAIEKKLVEINIVNITSLSQCNIEILNHHNNLHITQLNLINIALTKQTDLEVKYFTIRSAEAIVTALPIVTNQAEISIFPSEDMLEVQKLLQGINIIPGSGEYVYDTQIHNYFDYKTIIQDGTQIESRKDTGRSINSNNEINIADALYSIKSLKRICANVTWVSPVVNWFGVSEQDNSNNNHFINIYKKKSSYDKARLDIANIKILPGVENKKGNTIDPWHVSQYDRSNAHVISNDDRARPNYGGTINDASIVRYIESLREFNYKIMFYPMIFMDLPSKPWRGHITCKDTNKIHDFFAGKDGYNNFILHYAKLLKGKIDAFVIGSELKALTQVVNDNYLYPNVQRYPVVVELINLAEHVRAILGKEVIITYAADWSEYHHDENGCHHLDPLWASEYIDVVGIDTYFPITRKSEGDITNIEIKKGWESGELWDFYYKEGVATALSPEWGLKQIEYWWDNYHISHNITSMWKPRMKPIWFTEFGFPSIHMATNQPNIFYNPEAQDGGSPKYSSTNADFALQMRAIRATLEYWQNKSYMVQNMFLWTWDARPYPAFPEKLDLWSDGNLWSRGHWINGKIEPKSQVTLLADFNISTLSVYAEKLIIPGSNPKSVAKLIIADQVVLQNKIEGIDIGIKTRILHVIDAIEINLSGTLSLDSESDIIFSANKKNITRRDYNNHGSESYYDEYLKLPTIKAQKVLVKCPKLRIEGGGICSEEISMQLDTFELVTEVTNHIHEWSWIGTPHWLTHKYSTASGRTKKQEAYSAYIKCNNLTLAIKNRLYTKGAFIETLNFNGYAKNYLFEPLALESANTESRYQKGKFGGLVGSKRSSKAVQDNYFQGAILTIGEKGYAFSEEEIIFLGSYLIGEEIELEAKSITFKAAIGKHFDQFTITEKGIIFSTNTGSGEYAIGVSGYYNSIKGENYYETAHNAGAFVKSLKITADKLLLSGGVITGQNISIIVKDFITESPKLIGFYKQTQIKKEVGFKIGFQESISSTIDSAEKLFTNLGRNNPAVISAVNFVSNSRKLLMQATTIAGGNAIQGGVWAYGQASESHVGIYNEWGIENLINVNDLTVEADHWYMERLKLTGKNCVVKVKEIIAAFTSDKEIVKRSIKEINGQVGLYGNIGTSFGIGDSQFHSEEIRQHTNKIDISGSFYLEAQRLEGALTVEAEELEAIVSVLKLVSVQDIGKQSTKSFSASVGIAGDKIAGGNINGDKSSSNLIITRDGRSGFLGRNMLLVKSNSLIYLEGAYLDSNNGNLRVEAANIKTTALQDKATGWSAGLGIDSGNDVFGTGTRIIAGNKDLERNVPGAIGKGIIIIGDKEIDDAMSSLLGISRDTSLTELEGEDWYLDYTARIIDEEKLRKSWSGGIDGIVSRATGNAEEAITNVVTPVTTLLSMVQEEISKIYVSEKELDVIKATSLDLLEKKLETSKSINDAAPDKSVSDELQNIVKLRDTNPKLFVKQLIEYYKDHPEILDKKLGIKSGLIYNEDNKVVDFAAALYGYIAEKAENGAVAFAQKYPKTTKFLAGIFGEAVDLGVQGLRTAFGDERIDDSKLLLEIASNYIDSKFTPEQRDSVKFLGVAKLAKDSAVGLTKLGSKIKNKLGDLETPTPHQVGGASSHADGSTATKPHDEANNANPHVDTHSGINYNKLDLNSLGNLPGPGLPIRQASSYASGFNNRLLKNDEHFYRYHGVDNRSGQKYSYFTNKKYSSETELRSGLGIEDSWGIDITKVTEVKVPAGNWVSEGIAGPQLTYKGGDYQAVLSNVPKQWIVKTTEAFKNE